MIFGNLLHKDSDDPLESKLTKRRSNNWSKNQQQMTVDDDNFVAYIINYNAEHDERNRE